MNEFLDKLADLMEEYEVEFYNNGDEIEISNIEEIVYSKLSHIGSINIRALKTKEDD